MQPVVLPQRQTASRPLGRDAARSSRDASGLTYKHPVVVPIARDFDHSGQVIQLVRPTFHAMTESLRSMGLPEERAVRLPHECGRSVSILARRIPRAGVERPNWSDAPDLVPALLAGAWDRSIPGDRNILQRLSGLGEYDATEAAFRPYLKIPDAPLEVVQEVWAVRAPVDLYVYIDHLIGAEHWTRFESVARDVFGEIDPALDMPPEERIYANLHGERLKHSRWLRDGLASTLLILAVLAKDGSTVGDGRSPQKFVDDLVSSIPGLKTDWRVVASLSHQLPMLMEAAPVPLLSALEHLLKGDGETLKPIFQDSKDRSSLFGHSPHTGLLWALEVIGQDPNYLARAAEVLARLAEIDPGGSLSNRPTSSLHELFLAWRPRSNASLNMRLAVLDALRKKHPAEGWKLLLGLIPSGHDVSFSSITPRFRDAGLSERETVTYAMVDRTVSELTDRLIKLAESDAGRWTSLLDKLTSLNDENRSKVIVGLAVAVQHMSDLAKDATWQPLAATIRRHRTHLEMKWAMSGEQLDKLDAVLEQIAPQDKATLNRYLFQERLPDLPGVGIHDRWEKSEELRLEVVKELFQAKGIEGILRFASEVKAPHFVGGAFGRIAPDSATVMDAVISALDQGLEVRFISALSAGAFMTRRDEWMRTVKLAFQSGQIKEDGLGILMDMWPNEPFVWTWLDETGADPLETFWSRHHAWALKGSEQEFRYAIERYLEANKPEYVVDALGHQPASIPTNLLIAVLEAYEKRLIEDSSLIAQNGGYSLKEMFQELQKRDAVPLERVAVLEWKYLPVLRELFSVTDPNSALDRFLAENPEFFITIISYAFRKKSDSKEPRTELSAGDRSRAENSFRLLESFARIPGREGDSIDLEILDQWVEDVRVRAREMDLAEITDQFIGKLLEHAPADPEDHLWPHRVVREALERWQSDSIELGLHIGKVNSRGATTRGVYDGGNQERALAKEYRDEAAKLDRWPRSRALLIGLAESYEHSAEREDTRVEQMRLKE